LGHRVRLHYNPSLPETARKAIHLRSTPCNPGNATLESPPTPGLTRNDKKESWLGLPINYFKAIYI
jgi:hypothetical protein